MPPIELDGRTGEGGGQLVRVAIGLAALTSQSVTITNVRGNREGPRGGGLKSQHVTAIQWLAEATDADVQGLSVGSRTLTFIPRTPPTSLAQRSIRISAASGAASTLLVLQAILPFLLFAGDEPIEVELSGGTNVSFSLSFEYLDQVLLPALEESFSIRVERVLKQRGWSLGPQSRGTISIKVFPLGLGQKLQYKAPGPYTYPESYEVETVDVSLVIPSHAHETAQNALAKDLGGLFPGAEVRFKIIEDSGVDSRWYILLVATSRAGIRWGKDVLTSLSKKAKSKDTFVAQLTRKLCKDLYKEVSLGGHVDEHLQDQLVCFQALCDGYSSFPRREEAGSEPTGVVVDALGNLEIGNGRVRREKNHEPFGQGSLHTQTARWVVSELLPGVEFYNKGDFAKGVGLSLE